MQLIQSNFLGLFVKTKFLVLGAQRCIKLLCSQGIQNVILEGKVYLRKMRCIACVPGGTSSPWKHKVTYFAREASKCFLSGRRPDPAQRLSNLMCSYLNRCLRIYLSCLFLTQKLLFSSVCSELCSLKVQH